MDWSAALVADLLFGSRLQGALAAAEVRLELAPDVGRLEELIAAHDDAPQTLIVDLSDPDLDVAAAVAALSAAPVAGAPRTRTLGFYSHVHPDQRARGEQAGLELVVARSRMAREAPELVASLLGR